MAGFTQANLAPISPPPTELCYSMSMRAPGQSRLFYGWIVIAVAFVTMAVSVNARTGYSLLFPAISTEFGWSSAAISGAFALGFLCSSAFIPIAGIVMDRYGQLAAIANQRLVDLDVPALFEEDITEV